MKSIKLGDFSELAKGYINRPSYDIKLIEKIMAHINRSMPNIFVADVGAGTGKLTKVLAEMGCENIYAVEPNDEMRNEGKEYTKNLRGEVIKWLKGSGETTNLPGHCVDLVVMASSFHWTDPSRSLPEFSRILKNDGHLSIMWNTRDVGSSELHSEIEDLIYEIAPNIKRGSSGNSRYTKNWEEVLISTGHFKDVKAIETSYVERMSKERYINVWRTVNDIQAQAGPEKFAKILSKIEEKISSLEAIDVPYKMRSWTVKKIKETA
ncbi:MAG: class I SAM-dependent methyltransferase [Holosporaceae bacterium]|jgi:ubiquinone/menaquinone biosynthesis C-methylase UbiE|nr:class I SAM-dependent methyltransferase [Holosporaceae bacterium]